VCVRTNISYRVCVCERELVNEFVRVFEVEILGALFPAKVCTLCVKQSVNLFMEPCKTSEKVARSRRDDKTPSTILYKRESCEMTTALTTLKDDLVNCELTRTESE